jgi:ribonuclease HII
MPSKKSSPPEQLGLRWDAELGLIAGVDEAGRGPLAGRLYDEIRAKALCCSVAEASVAEIDELNILHATMLAMKRAVEGLRLKPTKVLVDGNRLPVLKVAAEAIVQGDALVPAISAASILAKVTRDRWCQQLHAAYPAYGFDGHKGYPTAAHVAALREHGACPEHRRSFGPVKQVLAR